MQKAVGIIGYGLLGAAIARRLRDAGNDISAFDTDSARTAFALSEGTQIATEIAALCASCPTLIIAVYSGEQVKDVLRTIMQVGGSTTDRTVLCVTTLDPDTAVAIAETATSGRITWIEYPISGSCRQVAGGEGLGLVAASPEALASHESMIVSITPLFFRIGDAGSAARAKLAINLVLELNRSALAEGLVFAEMLGLELNSFADLLRASAASSRVIGSKAGKMLAEDFTAEGRSSQSLKDVAMMLSLAETQGQRLPFTEVQRALLADCVASEEGDLDSAVVISAIRRARLEHGQLRVLQRS
jgi:L-threonate 2-dehydrogenase